MASPLAMNGAVPAHLTECCSLEAARSFLFTLPKGLHLMERRIEIAAVKLKYAVTYQGERIGEWRVPCVYFGHAGRPGFPHGGACAVVGGGAWTTGGGGA